MLSSEVGRSLEYFPARSRPMADGRLEVTDALGRRVIHIDKPVFSVGRRSGNDLQLVGSDVSRDHAEIATENGAFLLRDRGSRYGTYVNGEGITEHTLQHGDLVRLGRSGGAEIVFLLDDATQLASARPRPAHDVGGGRPAAGRGAARRAARAGLRPRARRGPGAGHGLGARGHRRRARLHHAGQRRAASSSSRSPAAAAA